MYQYVHEALKGAWLLAEREGFEPSERYKRSLPFQDSAIDHSAISPEFVNYIKQLSLIHI